MGKFYQSAEWVKTAGKVAKLDNYECQRCKREGRVTTRGMLGPEGKPLQMSAHHKKEVKHHPQLALSIFYKDGDGKLRRNIEYLCETCHNKTHHKFEKKAKGFVNEEWW